MKIKIQPRLAEKKREAKRIRAQGNIPAALYSREHATESIAISGQEFGHAMRNLTKGRLSTAIFSLIDEKNKERKALIKDIQYHPTTYAVLHIDFEELKEGVPVNVSIPIECTGAMDCAGIKLGGVLRQVIRGVKVQCLPKDIPSCFEIDVRDLGIKQYKKLSDLSIPAHIKPLVNLNEVAVVIAKK